MAEEQKTHSPKKSIDYAALARSLKASRTNSLENIPPINDSPPNPRASIGSRPKDTSPNPFGSNLGFQKLIEGYIRSASFTDNLMDRKGDVLKANKVKQVVQNSIMNTDIAR
jgi:hypothetical protein